MLQRSIYTCLAVTKPLVRRKLEGGCYNTQNKVRSFASENEVQNVSKGH